MEWGFWLASGVVIQPLFNCRWRDLVGSANGLNSYEALVRLVVRHAPLGF